MRFCDHCSAAEMMSWLEEFKSHLDSRKFYNLACELCSLQPYFEREGCPVCGGEYYEINPEKWLGLCRVAVAGMTTETRRKVRAYFRRDLKLHEKGHFDDEPNSKMPYPPGLICAEKEYAQKLLELLK